MIPGIGGGSEEGGGETPGIGGIPGIGGGDAAQQNEGTSEEAAPESAPSEAAPAEAPAEQPAQEALIADYDPWAGKVWPGRPDAG